MEDVFFRAELVGRHPLRNDIEQAKELIMHCINNTMV